MTKRRHIVIPISCMVAGAMMAFALLASYRAFRPTPRQALLLIGATDIHEYSAVSGFLPDFSYHLKARINERAVQRFLRRMNLDTIWSPGRDAYKGRWQQEGHWWQPSPDMTGTYIDYLPERSFVRMAKYEEGYLYYYAFKW